MYCPMVMVLPCLCRLVPSNVFPVEFCKSGVNVKVCKLV